MCGLQGWISISVIKQGNTGWLNDGMIFAAMTLLREQMKEKFCGWQSTQPGGLKPGQPFVQLLHVQKSHWITVSNYCVSAFADPCAFTAVAGLFLYRQK